MSQTTTHSDEQTGTVYVGGLKTKYLSAADMVLPLMCGICIHFIYIGLLIPITVLFYNNYDDLDTCMNNHFDILLTSLLAIHTLILIIDCIAIYGSINAKASGTNTCLNIILTSRLLLNGLEILLVFYGFYAVFMDSNKVNCWKQKDDNAVYILIILFLIFNLTVILFTWCCLYCCLGNTSSPTRTETHNNDNCFKRCCSAMIFGREASQVTSGFSGMGGLINILSYGDKYESPAEIITGLQLLRMLQKHHGIIDQNYDANPTLYKPLKNKQLIEDCIYYTLYSNAAYGIPLYSMTKPCFICCAPPCCLPSHFDDKYSDKTIPQKKKIVLRENKCCYPIQIDNSSFKTFIQRTHCTHPQENVLLVSQIGGLHKVNFYVVIDHDKECFVITIRGTLSLGDSITDANTEPELCKFSTYAQNKDKEKEEEEEDEKKEEEEDIQCYVHKGIGECAAGAFNTIMKSKHVLKEITDDKYKHYGIIICGHSLGAGTTVLLSLLFKYGQHKNLKHFINKHRKLFKAYAIAPPAVIDKNFACTKQKEISKFLTCVIYNHDMIPRLSFRALIRTRAAINILLTELNKETDHGPWYVYKKSISINKNTILEIFGNKSKYCNKNQNISNNIDSESEANEILLKKSSAEKEFMNDTQEEVNKISNAYDNEINNYFNQLTDDEKNDKKNKYLCENNQLLWNTKFCQIGQVIFAAKVNNENDNNKCCGGLCGTISNFCRCRCCLDPGDVKYKAYIASINNDNDNDDNLFCDKMIFSNNMLPDHMPHVYLDVLERLNK